MNKDDKGDQDDEDDLFKSKHYIALGDAWEDVKWASGAKDTALETTKLAGKAAWNVGVFAARFGVKFLKEAPKILAEQAARDKK